jgi:uncharacterized protein with von Willebrand factor type A (vWA) domain
LVSVLRGLGMPIAPTKHVDFLRGVDGLDLSDIDDLYWIGRVTLVSRADDLAMYDDAFREWFADCVVAPPEMIDADLEESETPAVDEQESKLDTMELGEGSGRDASVDELAGTRTFPATADVERLVCARLVSAMRSELPEERTRRLRPARRGRVLDLRRVLRSATRSGGEILELRYREAPHRPRKLLVLIDVSGSLKANSPDFLKCAHAVVTGAARSEVYTFGTRLTRITKTLRHDDVDDALRGLTDVVFDFDGGTRIGASLLQFLASSRRQTMARGAIVIVISDGLERGDPEPMVAGAERLARLAHRMVWLTPLAADPAYRPLTKAMIAIESSLDRLGSAASLDDLLDEMLHLGTVSAETRRGVGRQTVYRIPPKHSRSGESPSAYLRSDHNQSDRTSSDRDQGACI